MKFAIYRNMDNAIVAIIDSGVLSQGELPALGSGGYVEITDPEFDALQGGLFEPFGLPLWRESGGAIEARPFQEKWFAVIDPSDNVQGGVYSQRGRPPKVPGGYRYIEIDEATHDQIDGAGQFFPESSLPRWSVDGSDNVVENVDPRLVLEVTASATETDPASPVGFDFRILDGAGQVVNFSGPRLIRLQFLGPSGPENREARITFASGLASVAPRTLEAGVWSIYSHAPDVYRVTGDLIISVAESW